MIPATAHQLWIAAVWVIAIVAVVGQEINWHRNATDYEKRNWWKWREAPEKGDDDGC